MKDNKLKWYIADKEYVNYLRKLDLINDKIEKIKKNAMKLYNEKINNPESNVSKRCCDFKLLEKVSENYKKQ